MPIIFVGNKPKLQINPFFISLGSKSGSPTVHIRNSNRYITIIEFSFIIDNLLYNQLPGLTMGHSLPRWCCLPLRYSVGCGNYLHYDIYGLQVTPLYNTIWMDPPPLILCKCKEMSAIFLSGAAVGESLHGPAGSCIYYTGTCTQSNLDKTSMIAIRSCSVPVLDTIKQVSSSGDVKMPPEQW
jgi:hypothetical protein